MRSSTRALSLCLAACGFAAPGALAAKGQEPCEGNNVLVQKDAAAYAGPGFGHSVRYRFDRSRCVKVLRRSPDGAFLLVVSAPETALWVPSPGGSPADDTAAGDPPLQVETPFAVVVTQDAALYSEPRLRATVITTLEPATTMTVQGTSSDGQWWYGEAQGQRGWLPKAQTAPELPAAGQSPSAGTAPWVAPPLDVTADRTAPTTTVGSVDPMESGDTRLAEGSAAEGGAVRATDPTGVLGVPPRARRPGLTVALGASTWSQRYRSDAQNDPYHRYELSSTGGELQLSYGWRGDFPLVVDVRALLGGFGFDFTAAGQSATSYVPVGWLELSSRVGARLYGDPWVDVEAGFEFGASAVWITDLIVDGAVVPAFTPGVYLDALKPTLRAVSRLDGGRHGIVTLEASLPVGYYVMVYDPALLSDELPAVQDQLRLDEGSADPGADNAAPATEAPYLHPFVGVTVSGAYGFAVGDTLQLFLAGHSGLRQAFITGPGRRVLPSVDADPSTAWDAIYTEASNVDLFAGVSLGGSFAL